MPRKQTSWAPVDPIPVPKQIARVLVIKAKSKVVGTSSWGKTSAGSIPQPTSATLTASPISKSSASLPSDLVYSVDSVASIDSSMSRSKAEFPSLPVVPKPVRPSSSRARAKAIIPSPSSWGQSKEELWEELPPTGKKKKGKQSLQEFLLNERR